MKIIDLKGQKFGRLQVLSRALNSKAGHARWFCRCDCGRERVVQGVNLRSGNSKSCRSCSTSQNNQTHGQSGTPLYRVWQAMIQRCENPNDKYYKNYGGRGIKVCPEWKKDFTTFMTWALANGYEKGLSIDRINNDGNYESENCRFVPMARQSRNTRRNKPIKIGNEVKLAVDWAKQVGIIPQTLRWRFNAGWPEHRLLEPVTIKRSA